MLKKFWADTDNRLSLLCLLLLFLFTLVYFGPLLAGKVLPQGDVIKAKGMQQDVTEYREQFGEEPFWSDSMFGGMPSMTFSAVYSGNWMRYLARVLFLGLSYPLGFFFLGMALTFGLARSYKAPPFGALAAAIGYGLFGYFSLIIEAGHYNKFLVLATAPGVLWGLSLVYRERYWTGGILFLLSLGLNIYYNHPQMTYYLMIGVVIWVLFVAFEAIKTGKIRAFLMGSGLLVVLAAIALVMNAVPLKPLYDYTKHSTRGPTDLRDAPDNEKTGGLAKDYAYAWSYSREEMLAVLIPNAVGGSTSGEAMPEKGHTYKALKTRGYDQAFPQLRGLAYWGKQSFTSGPFYLGAVLLFGFALGAFLVKGPLKWGLLYVFVIDILLSLGQFSFSVEGSIVLLLLPVFYLLLRKRIPVARQPWAAVAIALIGVASIWSFEEAQASYSLFDLFFDSLPMANKFRAPSSMLVVAAFVAPWLAAMGWARLADTEVEKAEKVRAVLAAGGLVGGACLLLAAGKGLFFDFTGQYDGQVAKRLPPDIMEAIRQDRMGVFTADALRSFGFIAMATGLVWAYVAGHLKSVHLAMGGVAVLVLADQWVVNRRILNEESYQRPQQYEQNFQPRPADQLILQDTTYYRVFPVSRNPFNDGYTPYFHNSIGGYNAAKLRRYDEMADKYLLDAGSVPPIVNMLNTKYFITREPLTDTARFVPMLAGELAQQTGEYVYLNRNAYGPAWFVRYATQVDGPDEALDAISKTNLRYTAILEKTDNPQLPALPDSAIDFARERVELISQKNTELVYRTRSPYDRLLVLSEIYYPEGWLATVDDKPTPILRANYTLRAVVVPAGEHTLKLVFKPESIYQAESYARMASILTVIIVLAFGFMALRESRHSSN